MKLIKTQNDMELSSQAPDYPIVRDALWYRKCFINATTMEACVRRLEQLRLTLSVMTDEAKEAYNKAVKEEQK